MLGINTYVRLIQLYHSEQQLIYQNIRRDMKRKKFSEGSDFHTFITEN